MVMYLVLVTGTSIVDQDVHTAPFSERILHQVLPVRFKSDVSLDEVHGAWLVVCYSFTSNWAVVPSDRFIE